MFYLIPKHKEKIITKIIIVRIEKPKKLELNSETVYQELKKNNIVHPDMVMRQVMHETGWLKSRSATKDNNLFGLYSSRHKRYMRFSHWTESVKAYKSMIQNRYNGKENYYKFLKRIGYAKDKKYIHKLKKIKYERFVNKSKIITSK